MRQLLTALVLLASGWAGAQNTIVGYEHWLDELDAAGQRIFVPASGTSIAFSGINIPVDQLSPGLHRIHFRLRDSNGAWSSVLRRSFYIVSGEAVSLTSGEYWFDQQDDAGSRTAFTFATTQDLAITIDPVVSGLSLGLHRIHFRIRDDKDQWSAVLSRVVHIRSGEPVKLTLLRYWSDVSGNQPGDMTTMAIEPHVAMWDVVNEIGFCTWQATGATDVYFQLKDDHDQWSSVIQRTIDIDVVGLAPAQPGSISGPGAVEQDSTYTFFVPPVPGASSYGWILQPGWSGSSNGPSIDVTINTQVSPPDSIGVYAINACGESDTTWYVILNVGLEEVGTGGEVRLFPNPTTGQFTLALEGLGGPVDVKVFSATGQQVGSVQRLATGGRHTINLSEEANGLYLVQLQLADGVRVLRRVMKE